ncbi:MAG: hypothetical protein PHR00_00405 [Patescibacteria group bacterium]|nr:hypothetical protein [Patescibacteria group bacterium]
MEKETFGEKTYSYSRIEMLAALNLLDNNEISDEELVRQFAKKFNMEPINLERGYYSKKFFLKKSD